MKKINMADLYLTEMNNFIGTNNVSISYSALDTHMYVQ